MNQLVITPETEADMKRAISIAEGNGHELGGFKWSYPDCWIAKCSCGDWVELFEKSPGEIIFLGPTNLFTCNGQKLSTEK
jgi:hypothetical protein